MTLLSYQVFKAIVEQGSFQKAANVLGITPSAVSHAVSSMEEELGTALFIRSRTGNSLTHFGQELLPYINTVLTSEESLQQAVSELNGPKSGRIKVGTFSSVCTNWIPDILHTFAKENPNITVEVFQGTYSDVANWLKQGIIDFGFTSKSSAGDLPFEALCRDPLVCVVQKNYEKQSEGPMMPIDEMRNTPFIMLQESCDADIKEFLKKYEISYTSNCHVEDDLSALVMVESGFGFAIMPQMVLKGIPYNIDIYSFEEQAYRVVGLVTLNYGSMSPAAKSLYSHIMGMYRQEETE